MDSQRDDAVANNQTDLINQRHINRARPPLGTLYVCIIQVAPYVPSSSRWAGIEKPSRSWSLLETRAYATASSRCPTAVTGALLRFTVLALPITCHLSSFDSSCCPSDVLPTCPTRACGSEIRLRPKRVCGPRCSALPRLQQLFESHWTFPCFMMNLSLGFVNTSR